MFVDRNDAGRQLAERLVAYTGSGTLVYALPRGGVPVGIEVADRLGCDFDLLIARKIGHPMNAEYAIGAVTEDGSAVWNEAEVSRLSHDWIERAKSLGIEEANRRRHTYLAARRRADAHGKIVIVVDDGIATGYTMEAAIRGVRAHSPNKVIAAAPVAPVSAVARFQGIADEVVVVACPDDFVAIGQHYRDFRQLTDSDVMRILEEHARSGIRS